MRCTTCRIRCEIENWRLCRTYHSAEHDNGNGVPKTQGGQTLNPRRRHLLARVGGELRVGALGGARGGDGGDRDGDQLDLHELPQLFGGYVPGV